MTLYVAMDGDGIKEVRGLTVDGLGCEKLMSFCLWRLMMRARFLVRVVVRRRVVRAGGRVAWVGATAAAAATTVAAARAPPPG